MQPLPTTSAGVPGMGVQPSVWMAEPRLPNSWQRSNAAWLPECSDVVALVLLRASMVQRVNTTFAFMSCASADATSSSDAPA